MKFTRQPSRKELYALGEPFGSSATEARLDGKRRYGGGGGGGSQTATSYTSNVPEYAKGTFMNLVGKAEALSNVPYTPYTGERQAQFTPLQQQAFNSSAGLGPSQNLAQASGIARMAAAQGFGAGQFFPGQFALGNAPSQVTGGAGPSQVGIGNAPSQIALGAGPSQVGLGNAPMQVTGGTAPSQVNVGAGPQQVSAQQISAQQVSGPGNFLQVSGGGGPSQITGPNAAGVPGVTVPGQNALQQVSGPGSAQQLTTGSFTQPGAAQNYMNPYVQSVVNAQQREATRADDIARQARNARAVAAGAFGGSRQAIMEAEAARNLSTQLGDIQAQGLNQAFQQAQQQFNAEQQLGLSAQQANQRAGIDVSQMGLQAALANQRAGMDLINQQLAAQQANQRAGLDLAGLGQQAQQANQRAGLDYNQQLLAAQQANQRAGIDVSQMGLQAALANQQAGLTAGQANQQAGLTAGQANQRAGLEYGQQQLAAQQYNQRAGLDYNQQLAAIQQANQRAGLDYNQQMQAAQQANQRAGLDYGQQFLEAQRMAEQSRQYGANLGLEGARTGLQAAQALGQLGDVEFGQRQNAINMQYGMGSQQQQAIQRFLDQQYGDFQAQRDYPYQQLGFMSDLLRGAGGSTRQVYPGPSGLQTLAGLGTAAYGLRGMGGFKKGGKVKAGLADVAPDMGDYADGGIVGYAEGGTNKKPEDVATTAMGAVPVAAGAIDARLAAEAERSLAARNAMRARAGLSSLPAAADPKLLSKAGMARAVGKLGRFSAYVAPATVIADTIMDDPTERYYKRFGLDHGTEADRGTLKDIAKFATARALGFASDLGDTLTFGQARKLYADYVPAPAPNAAPNAAPTQEQTVNVPDQSATAAPAGGAGVGIGAAGFSAPQIGAGGPAMTLEQTLAAYNKASRLQDDVAAATKLQNEITAKQRAAAEAELAAYDADIKERGLAGLEREQRAKAGLQELEGRKGAIKGEALLQAGLAILAADPRRGGWGAIGEGLGVGLRQYRGDMAELTARKAKLDDTLDNIAELRRAEDSATRRERRGLAAQINKTEVDAAQQLMRIQIELGMKPKQELAQKAVQTYFQGREAQADRNLRAGIANADNASRASIAALYGTRGGRGAGAVLKPGTPAYEAAVAKAAAAYVKEGVTGPDGKLLMGPAAVQRARLLAEAAVRQGMTPELESPDTAGPGASQGWDIQRPK